MEDLSLGMIILIASIHSFFVMLAIVGGGGSSFINQPMMMFFGLPPKQAIVTDIVADFVSEAVMIFQYNKKKLVEWKIGILLSICSIFGAIFGSYVLHWIDVKLLVYLMVTVVCVFGIYNFISTFYGFEGGEKLKPKKVKHIYIAGSIFGFMMGGYNNILSMGEGQVVTMGVIYIFGMNYLKARGTAQLVFVPARLIALIFALYYGIIYVPLLIAIWIGGFFAGYFASHISFKIPEKILKKIFSVLILIIMIKLIFEYIIN